MGDEIFVLFVIGVIVALMVVGGFSLFTQQQESVKASVICKALYGNEAIATDVQVRGGLWDKLITCFNCLAPSGDEVGSYDVTKRICKEF